MVRKAGLEPACLSAPPPQDGVSANSTTSAPPTSASYASLLKGQKYYISRQQAGGRGQEAGHKGSREQWAGCRRQAQARATGNDSETTDDIYVATKKFLREEQFGLVAQLRRAAVSIVSNIAEGKGRGTERDFCHFLMCLLLPRS